MTREDPYSHDSSGAFPADAGRACAPSGLSRDASQAEPLVPNATGIPDFPLFDVDDAELAFGASADRYFGGDYDTAKRASAELSRLLREEADVANKLFFRGGRLSDYDRECLPNTDHAKVHRAIKALLSSWSPSHEQKVATVALALHHWTRPLALAAGARSDETPQAAQSEGRQSGPDRGNAQ